MATINEYLDGIIDDFQDYLAAGAHLCDLKEVHFDAGRVPDYESIHVQQLYLLRYAYAYAFEYKHMFQDLFEKEHFGNVVKATSFGCGTMIDYWALTQVVNPGTKINYRGIDVIDWGYKFRKRTQDTISFYLGDAAEEFEDFDRLTSDIYIFPKSISEFSDEDISRISRCFQVKEIAKRKLHLLISLRSDERSLARDMDKTKMLYSSLVHAGFETDDDYSERLVFTSQNKKIRELDSSFRHPGNVVELLKDLNQFCEGYENGDNCDVDCEERLCRWPMLSCRHLTWQLFTFRRGE